MRKSKRIIAILATVALIATMLVPTAVPAMAAGTNVSVLQTPNVEDNAWQQLGTVKVEVDVGALENNDSLTATLPNDFKFFDETKTTGLDFTSDASQSVYTLYDDINGSGTLNAGDVTHLRIVVPSKYSGDNNDLYQGGVQSLLPAILGTDELQLTVQNYAQTGEQNVFFIYFDSIWVKDGFDGDIVATIEAPSDSGFPSGSAVIARVPGGEVALTVPSVDSMSSDSDLLVKIRAKELTSGSFDKDTESMKIKLPNGFCFESFAAPAGFTALGGGYIAYREIWGNASIAFGPSTTINTSKDEISIHVSGETTKASYFEFAVMIAVDDEDQAKTGDVVARVRGESTFDKSDLPIATYGESGSKIEASGTVPDVIAGQYNQDVADLRITENVAGSLNSNKTITLELPACAKWTDVDTNDTDNGVKINLVGFVGSDARELKYRVTGSSTSDAAELKLEDFQIAVEPGFTGDIAVKVGGTEGLSGDVVIAHAKAAVEMTASAAPDVKIGMQNQAAGDLVIKENIAEAIKADKDLIVDLPDGVKFTSVPKVAVEGDLDVDNDNVKRQSEDNQLLIPIDGESSSPSTITISGIAYTIDRTVAEGNITVKLKGDAVMEVNDRSAIDDDFTDNNGAASGFELDIDGDGTTDFTMDGSSDGFFPTTTSAAKVANATCATPAPGEQKATAVFKVNDTNFTINGAAQTMDVAPMLGADGRVKLPVRFVAQAAGVSPANILFADGKVTLIKGDKVVQLVVGTNQLIINGVVISMDNVTEVVNGRTMMSLRWIAQALGCNVAWDETTQSVTVTL